jgi:hypothetical protein
MKNKANDPNYTTAINNEGKPPWNFINWSLLNKSEIKRNAYCQQLQDSVKTFKVDNPDTEITPTHLSEMIIDAAESTLSQPKPQALNWFDASEPIV